MLLTRLWVREAAANSKHYQMFARGHPRPLFPSTGGQAHPAVVVSFSTRVHQASKNVERTTPSIYQQLRCLTMIPRATPPSTKLDPAPFQAKYSDSVKSGRLVAVIVSGAVLLGNDEGYQAQDEKSMNISHQHTPLATQPIVHPVMYTKESLQLLHTAYNKMNDDMMAATKERTNLSRVIYDADMEEIMTECRSAVVNFIRNCNAALVQSLAERAADMSKTNIEKAELVKIVMEFADAKWDTNVECHEAMRKYCEKLAGEVASTRTRVASANKMVRDVTTKDMVMSQLEFAAVLRDAKVKFDVDVVDSKRLIRQDRENALQVANTVYLNTMKRGLLAKQTADNLAVQVEQDIIARVGKVSQSIVAACDHSVKEHTQAQKDYLESVKSIYADILQQKLELARASMLETPDPAYDEKLRLLSSTRNAALLAAQAARNKVLQEIEVVNKKVIGQAFASMVAVEEAHIEL